MLSGIDNLPASTPAIPKQIGIALLLLWQLAIAQLIYMVWQGKKKGRTLLLVLFVLYVLLVLRHTLVSKNLEEQALFTDIFLIGMETTAFYLLFTQPSQRWFIQNSSKN